MSSLKVLQIMGHGAFGGGTRVILAINRDLAKRGLEVIAICSDPEEVRAFQEIGCRTIPVKELRRQINPFNDFVALIKLRQICKREKVDIVNTHTSKGGVVGRIAARMAGVPVIIHHVHGFGFHSYSSRVETILYVHLEKLAARFCDRIITVSEAVTETALAHGIANTDKIITINNGIDPSKFKVSIDSAKLRDEFGIGSEARVVGMVGRLATQKGPEYYVKAIPNIRDRFPDVVFMMIGDGPLRLQLEELGKRLKIDEHLIFTGFRRDIPELLSLLDIVVVPSLWEGFGITLLEAMAAGKPVVASRVDAIPSVVAEGETGVLVPPKDVEALAEAILHLLQDEQRSIKMGRAGRKRMEEHFTEEMMLKRTWKTYQSLIDENLIRPTHR